MVVKSCNVVFLFLVASQLRIRRKIASTSRSFTKIIVKNRENSNYASDHIIYLLYHLVYRSIFKIKFNIICYIFSVVFEFMEICNTVLVIHYILSSEINSLRLFKMQFQPFHYGTFLWQFSKKHHRRLFRMKHYDVYIIIIFYKTNYVLLQLWKRVGELQSVRIIPTNCFYLNFCLPF